MATLQLSARRLILAGGFAVAMAAAPALAVVATLDDDRTPLAQSCPSGEETDTFTGVCVPHTVPNAGSPFTTLPGNPDVPTVLGVPCIGHNSGQCIGLAEEAQAMAPGTPPSSHIDHSPTVTG
ncbi:intersectin-EH binding protein Ibp1 [Mycolicibacterium sp. XJ1819]